MGLENSGRCFENDGVVLGQTQGNFSAKEFLGQPKGRAWKLGIVDDCAALAMGHPALGAATGVETCQRKSLACTQGKLGC
jgi:hypothetical protein